MLCMLAQTPRKLNESRLAFSRRELRAISGKSRNRRIHGRRRLSVDMALRLARLFGTSERFWLNLQNEY